MGKQAAGSSRKEGRWRNLILSMSKESGFWRRGKREMFGRMEWKKDSQDPVLDLGNKCKYSHTKDGSGESSEPVNQWRCCHVRLFATPWSVAHQAPLSMEFSRQEYWGGLSFPSPEDLPNPGIEPRSPALQADAFTIWATREAQAKAVLVGKTRGEWNENFEKVV